MDVLTTVSTRRTPQSEKADPRQIKNAAGGYTFAVDDWARVHRFLTLGTDGGTYYTSAADLTRDNAEVILRAAATDPERLVRCIVEVSTAGRAPKQNPAIFALAIAASCDSEAGRRAALAALPAVARTGTHLFLFARYVEQFRGWGRALRNAVGGWYNARPALTVALEEAGYRRQNGDVQWLAYQAAKYRQREGWTHGDLLRLSHPAGITDPARRMVLNWAVGKGLNDYAEKAPVLTADELAAGERTPARPALPRVEDVPDVVAIIAAFEDAQAATSVRQWVEIIGRGHGLSWEMLPDAALGHREVWEALLEQGIPQTALMRQLPRLTRLGLTAGATGHTIAAQLQDADRLIRARVHPINVLVAQRTYTSGRSARGESTWTPAPVISDALDAAFYSAFAAVEPTGKRTLLALDVSRSMGAPVSGLPLTCREAAGALAMVTAAVEPDRRIVGFTADDPRNWTKGSALVGLDVSPRRRLDDNLRAISGLPFGRTDCALPMVWALHNRVEVDTFVILTDNETWHGSIHPHQALRAYRESMGIDARLAVVAMTATGNSIADPSDPGQLDVSGFDSAVPQLLADFSRGTI